MTTYIIEKLGGIAGFGGPFARIRSIGTIDERSLSLKDRDYLQNLFLSYSTKRFTQQCDEFIFRIIQKNDNEEKRIDVPESLLPDSIRSCVRDEFV
jgi:hypothetical protein